VLKAQVDAIETVKPGAHWDDPHNMTVQVLTEGLVKLGLLKGEVPALIESGAYREFYMHRAGHWLGMDVHDVGAYFRAKAPRPLEPGMVLTVEPGIYIAANNTAVPPSFRGIGVRIEDDVLVTADGHSNLTADIPKSVDEIERACA